GETWAVGARVGAGVAVGWGVGVGLVCLQAPTHTRTISTSAAAMAPVLNAPPIPHPSQASSLPI
ncbi:MAG: hypothetical protein ABIG98_06195, partial [Chloroflexota bacterium]